MSDPQDALLKMLLAPVKADAPDDGYWSSQKLAEALGIGRAAVIIRLRNLERRGMAFERRMLHAVDFAGKPCRIPGYRLVEAKGGKK